MANIDDEEWKVRFDFKRELDPRFQFESNQCEPQFDDDEVCVCVCVMVVA